MVPAVQLDPGMEVAGAAKPGLNSRNDLIYQAKGGLNKDNRIVINKWFGVNTSKIST